MVLPNFSETGINWHKLHSNKSANLRPHLVFHAGSLNNPRTDRARRLFFRGTRALVKANQGNIFFRYILEAVPNSLMSKLHALCE